MKEDFNILLQKLNRFKKKYYQNQLLKGLIYSLAIILVIYLLGNTLEYFIWAGPIFRKTLFFSFTALVIVVFFFYILIPLTKLINLGKTISNDEAARLIGKHFDKEVGDKLLNTLQLNSMMGGKMSRLETDLLIAGIDQKAKRLSPVPFSRAIDFKANIKYLKYVLPPLLIILAGIILFPSFITEPSQRIIHYNEHYSKPLPYEISLLNNRLEVLQNEDYKIEVKVKGEAFPAGISISDENYRYKMFDEGKGRYSYTFKNVNRDIYFKLTTAEYSSETFHLKMIPKPIIYNFEIYLHYSPYLLKKDEVIENSGDITVPEGTTITWKVYTKDTDSLYFRDPEGVWSLKKNNNQSFERTMMAKQSFWYSITAENSYVKNYDSLFYNVQVIKDEYPKIEIQRFSSDELIDDNLYFTGLISDDYGFHSLKIYYKRENEGGNNWLSSDLNMDPSLPRQQVNYVFYPSQFGISQGESFRYFFEVRDNDALNGYKKAKTPVQSISLASLKDLGEKKNQTSEEIKEKLKQMLDELKNIQKEIDKKQEELFRKNEIGWQDKKQVSDLLEKQKALNNQLEEIKKLNDDLSDLEEKMKTEPDEALKEKLDQLNKMLEKLETENVEKIKEELDKLDKDQLNEMLEKVNQQNNSLENDLEKDLEFYKQLEFEKKVQEAVEDLKELSDEQLKLAEETKNKEKQNDELLEKQEQIKESFEEIKNELKNSEDLNEQLEEPFEFEVDQEQMNSIDSEMKEAGSKLENGKPKKASDNQQNAGNKMQEMADGLNMMMQSAMQSRLGEDAEKVEKMLDNLLDLSFSQEELIKSVRETNQNDPKYVDNLGDLQLLKDGFLVLRDSLLALSKRQMAVQQFVVDEADKINLHINRALLYLQERKKGQALSDQQYSMTSMNNLALMLSESLDQMKAGMQMSGNNPGKSCPTPGKGAPSTLEQILQMQQGMNKGMEKGNRQKGKNGENGLNEQSEKLARMAALQSEIRKKLSEFLDEYNEQNGGNGDLRSLIDEMKKTEDDIVNRRITKETLERQKQIEVRLLKSEKAKLEREKKETRESEEGTNRRVNNPESTISKIENKKSNEDLLHSKPIEMSPYFNNLLKQYLYKIETKNGI